MTAEQFLNDLETKANKALFILKHPPTDDPSSPVDHADIDACEMQAFFDAADPATVLRLVAMVRFLALRASASTCPNGWECKNGSHDCEICNTHYAYQQTEPKP